MKYRDDDISVHTDLSLFKKFHEAFMRNNEIHTCAIIARDIWKNRELTHYLETQPLLDLQYHGLDHIDYSKISEKECYEQLKEGKEYLEEKLHRRIKVFYPPWNIEDQMVRSVCDRLGLKYDNRRVEARDYLNGAAGERVNLHYWQDQDIIEEVLNKHRKSEARKMFHNLLAVLKAEISNKKSPKILHIGKTHVYDYGAYFPWGEFLELDNDPELNPDILGSIEGIDKDLVRDNYFDVIICFGVLDVVKNKASSIQEIYRLLKPDGKALIGFPMTPETFFLHREVKETFSEVHEIKSVEVDMESFPNNSKEYIHYLITKK